MDRVGRTPLFPVQDEGVELPIPHPSTHIVGNSANFGIRFLASDAPNACRKGLSSGSFEER